MKIILASRSPRRRELLSTLVEEFEIITEETDETLPDGVHPREGVEILARRKGEVVASSHPDALVISSDTLVELGGIPLGKPSDKEDAVRTLMTLSCKTHHVHTGVAVHYRGRVFSGCDTADVTFRSFSEKEAREYVSTGEPMDKAGSYAIQGIGRALVEGYSGEFDAIVGLGRVLLAKLMKEAVL